MNSEHPSTARNRIMQAGRWLLCYSLWLVTVAAGILALLRTRQLLLTIMAVTGTGRWLAGFLDKAGLILFALILVILLVLFEHLFNESCRKNTLWHLFSRIAGFEALYLGLSDLASMLLTGSYDSAAAWIVCLTEFLVGTILLLSPRFFRSRPSSF